MRTSIFWRSTAAILSTIGLASASAAGLVAQRAAGSGAGEGGRSSTPAAASSTTAAGEPDFVRVQRPRLTFGPSRLAIVQARLRPQNGEPFVVLTPLAADVVSSQGLVPEAILGRLRSAPDDGVVQPLDPANFLPNPQFVEFLHGIVRQFAPALPEYQNLARNQRSGWIYVIDGRSSGGTYVRATDVIGAFGVKGGIARPEAYRPNPDYALLSSDGFPQLHPVLKDQLIGGLVALNAKQER
jgi:hypothetical protein